MEYSLKPVDYDPFYEDPASPPEIPGFKLRPVSYDPFAEDKPELSMERVGGAIGEGVKDVARTTMHTLAGVAEYGLPEPVRAGVEAAIPALKATRLIPGAITKPVAEKFKESASSPLLETEPEYAGKSSGWIEDFARSAPQMGTQIIATLAGGPLAGMGLMGLQITGSTYENAIKAGKDPKNALAWGIANAIVQSPMEQIGIGKISKLWKPQQTIIAKLKEIGEAAGVEWLTEFLQSYPDSMANIFATNPDKTAKENLKKFRADLWETTKQGAYEGTMTAPWALLGLGGIRRAKAPKIVEGGPEAAPPQPAEDQQAAMAKKLEADYLTGDVTIETIPEILKQVPKDSPIYQTGQRLLKDYQQIQAEQPIDLGVVPETIPKAIVKEEPVEEQAPAYAPEDMEKQEQLFDLNKGLLQQRLAQEEQQGAETIRINEKSLFPGEEAGLGVPAPAGQLIQGAEQEALRPGPGEIGQNIQFQEPEKPGGTEQPLALPEPVKPTAEFVGWQERTGGKKPFALYNIIGGKSDGSTVSWPKLAELGIEIPKTPPMPVKEKAKPKPKPQVKPTVVEQPPVEAKSPFEKRLETKTVQGLESIISVQRRKIADLEKKMKPYVDGLYGDLEDYEKEMLKEDQRLLDESRKSLEIAEKILSQKGAPGLTEAIGQAAQEAAGEPPVEAKAPVEAGKALGEQVRELALEEQRKRGWDSKWPFVPADLGNMDFRWAIANDTALSKDEKNKIFEAGKKLKVVPQGETVETYEGKPLKAKAKEVIPRGEEKGQEGQREALLEKEPAPPQAVVPEGQVAKEAWEMTQEEYIPHWEKEAGVKKFRGEAERLANLRVAKYSHEARVKQALKAGENVPASVLADYPDLVKKPTQAPAEAVPAPKEAEPAKVVLSKEEALKKKQEQFKTNIEKGKLSQPRTVREWIKRKGGIDNRDPGWKGEWEDFMKTNLDLFASKAKGGKYMDILVSMWNEEFPHRKIERVDELFYMIQNNTLLERGMEEKEETDIKAHDKKEQKDFFEKDEQTLNAATLLFGLTESPEKARMALEKKYGKTWYWSRKFNEDLAKATEEADRRRLDEVRAKVAGYLEGQGYDSSLASEVLNDDALLKKTLDLIDEETAIGNEIREQQSLFNKPKEEFKLKPSESTPLEQAELRGEKKAKLPEGEKIRAKIPEGKIQPPTTGKAGMLFEEMKGPQKDLFEQPPAELPKEAKVEEKATGEAIQDFGEKIGGARKDTAERGFTKGTIEKPEDNEPWWKKRYKALEKTDGSGRWVIADVKAETFTRFRGTEQTFDSLEEAEKAIPLYAVAKNHSVYTNKDNTFSIFKKVSDRKRLKVVNQDFSNRDDAMKYMATHAEEILSIKTTFGEEILPVPEVALRKGKERRQTDATPEMFMETFAPRGIEFGNWNNQEERQKVMNHAYDGLLDLADVLGVPPKALMLNGELAIAFGARGQGLSGAKAHYETDYGIINLTKMKGAGSLGHEWFHALDHYFARQDTKAPSERVKNKRGDMVFPEGSPRARMITHGESYKTKLRPEIVKAYKTLMETMYSKAQQYVEDTKQADRFIFAARENLKTVLDGLRSELKMDHSRYYTDRPKKKGIKPASAEQLAEFDRLANILVEGGDLETKFQYNVTPGEKTVSKEESVREKTRSRSQLGKLMAGRFTNSTLEGINAIYKAVRNRSGFNTEKRGTLDSIRTAMTLYAARLKMFEDAKAGTEKTKKVPTNYAIEARKMDQARTGDYWSEPHEMAARAFAAYVEDKVKESGGQSDFLVYHAHGGIFIPMIDGFVARPYPEGSEREAIGKKFDDLIQTLETKETDKGVMLLRAEGEKAALSPENLRNAADTTRYVYQFMRMAGAEQEVLDRIKVEAGPFIDLRGKNYEQSRDEWVASGGDPNNLFGAVTIYKTHAVVQISMNIMNLKQLELTAIHEWYHIAKRWLMPSKEAKQISGFFPGEEGSKGEAESFAVFCRTRRIEGVKGDVSALHRLWMKLRRYLQIIANGLKGKGWTRPEDIFGKVYVGAYSPKFEGAGETALQSYAPTFYSQMQNILDKKLPGAGTAQQFRQMIKSWADKGEFKADEWKWSGVDEWLAGKEGKVTKQDILDFLKANEVQIREVTKGEYPNRYEEFVTKMEAKYGEGYSSEALTVAEREEQGHLWTLTQQRGGMRESDTKFSQWQLPGGENYRELLLTLPVKMDLTKLPEGFSIKKRLLNGKERFEVIGPGTGRYASGDTLAQAIASFHNLHPDSTGYRSSHWSEPNVLAHVRYNDRTGPNGEKVLFIEEVQSDWHQAGRKKGYAGELNKSEVELLEQDDTQWVIGIKDEQGNYVGIGKDEAKTVDEAIDKAIPYLTKNFRMGRRVPPAPFSKTWHELAMKRMLRYAAESGNTEWAMVSEPESGREQFENYIGRELASVFPFKVMDAAMLSPLKNDKISEAVIEAIPVNVVNILSDNGFSAEDLLSKPDMVGKALSVDDRSSVARGFSDALELVGTRLRTALNGVLSSESSRGNEELLPAVRASDLSSREVIGLLAPHRIYMVNKAKGDMSFSGLRRTLSGTKTPGTMTPQIDLAGEGPELSATELANALNRHEKIISGRVDNVKKFDPGYEILAWTPGSVQAERYDLSKHLKEVRYHRYGEDFERYNITGILANGNEHSFGVFTANELPDVVGKELADKIIKGERATSWTYADRNGTIQSVVYTSKDMAESVAKEDDGEVFVKGGQFSGLDLKVGGEGMKGFYDKILPDYLNKYAKKWGARVEDTEIPNVQVNPKRRYGAQENNGLYGIFDLQEDNFVEGTTFYKTYQAAADRAQEMNGITKTTTVHSLPVTESMRDSVMSQGQAMFRTDEPNPILSAITSLQRPGQPRQLVSISELRDKVVGENTGIQTTKFPLINKAMKAEYASGVDITSEWKTMTPKERQDVIANGLHIETDRSGLKVIGNISQDKKTQILRDKVLSNRAGKMTNAEFDAALLQLSRESKVALHSRDFPSELSEAARAKLLKDERGTYYVGVVPKGETLLRADPNEDAKAKAQAWIATWEGNAIKEVSKPEHSRFRALESLTRPFNDFMYWIVDKNRPIQLIQSKLEKVGDEIDVFLKETQRPKRTAAQVKQAWNDSIRPMLKKMAEFHISIPDLEEYSHAKHAHEANIALRHANAKRFLDIILGSAKGQDVANFQESVKEDLYPEEFHERLMEAFDLFGATDEVQKIKKQWDKFSERPSGMSDSEATEILKKYKGDRNIEEIRLLLADINNNKLQILYDAGLVPDEEYEAIKKKYKFYVPLHREGYDDTLFGSSRGLKPSGRPIKVRGGSIRNVVNIVGNSISNLEKAINLSEKAISTKALKGLVDDNPDPAVWRLKAEKKSPHFDSAGNIRMYPDMFSMGDNEFRFMADGKQYILEVNRDDKDAMLMLRTLRADDSMSGPIVNTLSKVNRFLARVNTSWSPEFVVTNFARDLQSAGINIRDTDIKSKRLFRGAIESARAIYRVEREKQKGDELEDLYGRFKKAGGKIGWSDVHGSVERLSKGLTKDLEILEGKRPVYKTVRDWMKWIEDANTSVENGVRLHTFKLAVDQGMTDERAAQIASDLTVDFTKKGAAGPVINSLYLFANAGIQGSYRIVRAGIKSPKVRYIMAGIIGAGFLNGLLNSISGGDDDDGEDYFNKIDDFVRERNAIFMIPGTKGKYVKLPLPWGYNFMWNVGNEMSRAFTKQNYNPLKGAARIASVFANAFNPVASGTLLQTIAPTILDPFAQVAENKNWFGGDLMPAKNIFEKTPTPDSQRYWKSARGLSVWVAGQLNSLTGGDKIKQGAIDVSPETLDLIVDTIGGSALRFFTDIADVPQKMIREEKTAIHQYPFVRRVAGEPSEWGNSKTYHENVEEVFVAQERLKAYRGTDMYQTAYEDAKSMRSLFGAANWAESNLRKLRTQKKAAEATKNKEAVKRIEERMNEVYVRFNKWYNEAALRQKQ